MFGKIRDHESLIGVSASILFFNRNKEKKVLNFCIKKSVFS